VREVRFAILVAEGEAGAVLILARRDCVGLPTSLSAIGGSVIAWRLFCCHRECRAICGLADRGHHVMGRGLLNHVTVFMDTVEAAVG
jgi:hypothetical protein